MCENILTNFDLNDNHIISYKHADTREIVKTTPTCKLLINNLHCLKEFRNQFDKDYFFKKKLSTAVQAPHL